MMKIQDVRRPLQILLSIVLASWQNSLGQTVEGWETLPNAPVTSRHNDAYFVTPELGWIVDGVAEIYRTTDGGDSWDLQLFLPNAHFRSVGFVDESTGWVGNVGLGEFGTTDPVVLRETRNGGLTWSPVENFDGPRPIGICGMDVVNDSVVVAVGRVRGPSVFVKTTDRGATWTSKTMTPYAAGLIDVHFFSPDTGFAVGLSDIDHEESSGVILYTEDGGETWEKRFTTTRTGEWFWKMSWPSRNVGYASLQRNSRTPIYFVKTTDGGKTWTERFFSGRYYFVQGIGFIDEEVGWIGGNSSNPSYETDDGGLTWRPAGFGSRMNRVRFLGDTLAYAVGSRVWKYRRASKIEFDDPEAPTRITLRQNHPNPFSDKTSIEYTISESADIEATVFDVTGRPVWRVAAHRTPGTHTIMWDGRDGSGNRVAEGAYVLQVRAGNVSETRVVHLVR